MTVPLITPEAVTAVVVWLRELDLEARMTSRQVVLAMSTAKCGLSGENYFQGSRKKREILAKLAIRLAQFTEPGVALMLRNILEDDEERILVSFPPGWTAVSRVDFSVVLAFLSVVGTSDSTEDMQWNAARRHVDIPVCGHLGSRPDEVEARPISFEKALALLQEHWMMLELLCGELLAGLLQPA